MHGMDGTLNGALRCGPAILNKLVSMGKLRKMARSYQVNGKGYKVSSRLPSLLTVEDDLVEAEVLSESMIGGDDDTKLRLSSRNTLGHKRNRNRILNKHVEWCGRIREVVVKQNEKNRKMAETSWIARAHGVSEARVHGARWPVCTGSPESGRTTRIPW